MNQGASFLVQQQELVEADKGSDVKIGTKYCKKSLSKNAIWLKKIFAKQEADDRS